jgi:hypothetical protein
MASKQQAASTLDPLFVAQSLLRRRKFQQCIELCDQVLQQNCLDKVCQAVSLN